MEKARGCPRTPKSGSSVVNTGLNRSEARGKLRGRARTFFERSFGNTKYAEKVTKMGQHTSRRAVRMYLVGDQSTTEGAT